MLAITQTAWLLARRALDAHRARTVLCTIAVALAVSMTIAADVVSSAILGTIANSPDAQTFMSGLLDQLDVMLSLTGVGIALAAGLLVWNAFAMSLTQRRRQIALLRALGATRRQVRRAVLVEAALTGVLGTCAGLVAGPLLGRGAIAVVRAFMDDVFAFAAHGASPQVVVLAAALGLGVTVLSAWVPARRAARTAPVVALRRDGVPSAGGVRAVRRGWVWAMLGIAALAAYLGLAPPGKYVDAPWNTVLTVLLSLLWLVGLGALAPAAIEGLGRALRARSWRVTGRLVADSLRRDRARVTLTVLTLAIGLGLIVGTSGLIWFMFHELMLPQLERAAQMGAWTVSAFDFAGGMDAYAGQGDLALAPQTIAQIETAAGPRAHTMAWRFAIVPELSFFGSTYFSLVADPRGVQHAGDAFFAFLEGSWETALPVMERGCGVLLSPAVAEQNRVSLGASLRVTGADGPVTCTVAGIGAPYVGASIIGAHAREAFVTTRPIVLLVLPKAGVDRVALDADLRAAAASVPGATVRELAEMTEMQMRVISRLPDLFGTLLLLAIVAAALGVTNTMLVSVTERRHELGLYRAVGATRRQVIALVTGEAALIGLTGGALGLIAGAGVVAIIAVTYGGRSWGVVDLALWPAAWRAVRATLPAGMVGVALAPAICAAVAWPPVRAASRGTPAETLRPAGETG